MESIIVITLITVVASGVGTLTGFGTSTIMVPILLFFLPLPQTLLLVGIIHWVGDIWKMLLFRQGAGMRLLLSFGGASVLAAYIGAQLSFQVSEQLLSVLLGCFLLGYTVFLLLKSQWRLPENTLTASLGGALSGFMAGIFGIGGAVRGAFLTAYNLPKHTYVFTAGAIAFVTDTTRILTYLSGDVSLTSQLWWGFFAFIPASFVGAWLAKRITDRIPQRAFRTVVAVFLGLAAIKLIVFA